MKYLKVHMVFSMFAFFRQPLTNLIRFTWHPWWKWPYILIFNNTLKIWKKESVCCDKFVTVGNVFNEPSESFYPSRTCVFSWFTPVTFLVQTSFIIQQQICIKPKLKKSHVRTLTTDLGWTELVSFFHPEEDVFMPVMYEKLMEREW